MLKVNASFAFFPFSLTYVNRLVRKSLKTARFCRAGRKAVS